MDPGCPGPLATVPEGKAGHLMSLLFGLAPGGVCLADRSPGRWCALTAPFHPYSRACSTAAERLTSGLISVALSLGSPPLGITQHPALWSSDFPRAQSRVGDLRSRPPDLLACQMVSLSLNAIFLLTRAYLTTVLRPCQIRLAAVGSRTRTLGRVRLDAPVSELVRS